MLTRFPQRRRFLRSVTVAVSLTACVAGCGARVEPAAGGEPAPVTVTNCGRPATYTLPKRPVVYDIGSTEMMLSLGLADRLRGYVAHRFVNADIESSPWRDDLAKVRRLGDAQISKEIILSAEADWVFAGWGTGFSESRGLTPESLDQAGVRTYLLTESCRGGKEKQRGVMSPLDALYTDIENLGRIFRVEDRARRVVADARRRIAALEAGRPRDAVRPKVFVYDSGVEQAYTSGRFAGPQDVIDKAGGQNIFGDLADSWTNVGWEPVVRANPDVILINDYGDQPLAQKRAFLEAHPALRNVPAVREKRFFALSYGSLVTGPRNIDAAEKFGAYLRSIGR